MSKNKDKINYALPPTKLFLVIGIIVIYVGLMVLGYGIFLTASTASQRKNYVETSATVIGFEERESHNSNHLPQTLYAEIVEYTVNGKKYTAVSDMASSNPHAKGSKIQIAYNPDNPEKCIFINSRIGLLILLYVLGVAFVGGGIALLVYFKKERDRYIEFKKTDI